jgi:osmotically-inducible protein OsmY
MAAPAAASGGSVGVSRGGAAASANSTTAVNPANPATRINPESGNTVPGNGINAPGQPSQSGVFDPTATTTTSSSTAVPSTDQSGTTSEGAGGRPIAPNISASTGQAVTASDRMLLATLTQTVSTQLGVAPQNSQNSQTVNSQTANSQTVNSQTINPSPALPVRFLINNGAVTLVGTVPTADESQRIQARVQQTPGVLSVFNDLRVGTTAQTAATQQPSFVGAMTDHAFSPADRSLLTAVQQSAGTQLGITGASTAQMPVHFSIENGVVGVTGRVSSLEEKQALIAVIQRTTGVARVVDNVAIANPAAGGVNSTTGNQNPFLNNNNNLPATSREGMGATNTIFLNTTNSSGF